MTDSQAAPRTPPPAAPAATVKKRGGIWKWFACGCAVLLLVILAAAGVAGFLAYRGVLFAKKKGAETMGRLQEQGGVPMTRGRLDAAKMRDFFDASEDWPEVKRAMDSGDRDALDGHARRIGLDSGRELEQYMAVVILAGGMTFVPEGARRQMLTQSQGKDVADVVMAPENQEKVRRFLRE
jgi:hypothetical protein